MSDTTTEKPTETVMLQQPRRRHTVFYWLGIAFLATLLLPVIAYLGALAYVSWGFANGTVTQKLSSLFGAPVRIGDVRTRWLRNLKIEKIGVEGPGGTVPVSVDAVTLDWDAGPLLQERRIRAAVIEKPRVALRREADGTWNIHPKLATGEGGYRIEQFVMREGGLSVEWPVGEATGATPRSVARLNLQALSGTFADNGTLMPQPFSLYGVFDSLESISVNGSIGPGNNWVARVYGGIRLERDLADVLYPTPQPVPKPAETIRGRVRYDLSGRSDMLPDAAGSNTMSFSGQFLLDDLQWPLSLSLAVAAPSRTLDILGTAKLDSGPDALAAFPALQLRVDGVGSLSGAGQLALKPALHGVLREVHGTIDAEALNQLFQPHLWGDALSLKGSVKLSGLSATLPFSLGAPGLALAARFSASGARVACKGLGELPLCDVDGTLTWPALQNVRVTMGDMAAATFSLNDVNPAGENPWLALAGATTVHDIQVDLGRFWESEVGRRVLTATFDIAKPVPAVAELPYILQGKLSGTDLKLVSEHSATPLPPLAKKATHVALSGIRIEDARITKWPFAFHLPARKFDGVLDVSADLAGDAVQSVRVRGQMSVPGDGTARTPGIALEFEQTYQPQAPEAQRIGPVGIKSLLLVLEQVEQVFELRQMLGIGGSGMLRITDTTFDPATGNAKGTIEADGVTLTVGLPRGVQEAILSYVRFSNPLAVPMFESNPTEAADLVGVTARMTAELRNGRLMLQGHVDPIEVRGVLPALGEKKLAVLPACDVSLEVDLTASEKWRSLKLRLALADGTKFDLLIKQPALQAGAPNAGAGSWVVQGTVETPFGGGIASTFDMPFDLDERTLGPVSVKVKDLDLAKLDKLVAGAAVQRPAGHLKDVALRVEQYSLKALATTKKWEVSGSFSDVGFDGPQAEVAHLTGELRAVGSYSADSMYLNAIVRLKSYEALLNGGAFYIPPPAQDRGGSLSLRAKYSRREKGADIKLELLQADLGGEIQCETSGLLALTGANLAKAELNTLKVRVPDLAQARRTFGPANLDNRAPWFGDIGLSGAGRFDGKLAWDAGGGLDLDGKFGFDGTTFTLGKTAAFTLRDVSGELPVVLRVSSWLKSDEGNAAPPPELRSRLQLGPLAYAGLSAPRQELELVATPNSLTVATPIKLGTPAGQAVVGRLALTNLLPTADAQPEIAFGVGMGVEADRLFRANSIAVAGIEGLVLKGEQLLCVLRRTTGMRGPWELVTRGALSGPFFGGQVAIENVNARGLFGPTPVFGGDLRIAGKEGIGLTQLTEKNPQFGKVAVRANASLTGFETTSASLDGIQAFVAEVRSVDVTDKEYYYDGRFPMAVAPELMRAAFPRFLYSDEFLNSERVRELKFGVETVGVQFRLQDGLLRGPIPLLDDGYIISAYGAESFGVLMGQRIKHGVKGDKDHTVPWADVVKQFKRATGK